MPLCTTPIVYFLHFYSLPVRRRPEPSQPFYNLFEPEVVTQARPHRPPARGEIWGGGGRSHLPLILSRHYSSGQVSQADKTPPLVTRARIWEHTLLHSILTLSQILSVVQSSCWPVCVPAPLTCLLLNTFSLTNCASPTCPSLHSASIRPAHWRHRRDSSVSLYNSYTSWNIIPVVITENITRESYNRLRGNISRGY